MNILDLFRQYFRRDSPEVKQLKLEMAEVYFKATHPVVIRDPALSHMAQVMAIMSAGDEELNRFKVLRAQMVGLIGENRIQKFCLTLLQKR